MAVPWSRRLAGPHLRERPLASRHYRPSKKRTPLRIETRQIAVQLEKDRGEQAGGVGLVPQHSHQQREDCRRVKIVETGESRLPTCLQLPQKILLRRPRA